ncbi:hypothetical protein ACA30_04150 [Virgibacillus soli]|nr:hypothetical protein ACA30_04150 [Virgibacillus soli]
MIKEWNFLRVLACLSIVFLHSTTNMGQVKGHPDIEIYHFLRALLCYATPTFIIISEMILSHRYQEKLPNDFWNKRIKYIYCPFVVFAIIDAFVTISLSPNQHLLRKMADNIFLGSYSGWFVLVIIQFYLLHLFVIKFKVSMRFLLPISFIIMVIHLLIINSDLAFVRTYKPYLHIPFTAWFGYFTLAYVLGKNYGQFREKLLTNRWPLLIGTIFAFGILYFGFFIVGDSAVNSRRIDLFPFVIMFSLSILAWGQYIKNFRIITFFNNYSFGIYLVHWQVQRLIAPHVAELFSRTHMQVVFLFITSLIVSLLLIKIISMLPFGAYIVGKTKKNHKKNNLAFGELAS